MSNVPPITTTSQARAEPHGDTEKGEGMERGKTATVSTTAAVVSVVLVCLVNLAGTSYLAGQVVEQVKGLQFNVADMKRSVDGIQREQARMATDVAVTAATLRAKGFDVPIANTRTTSTQQ